MNQVTGLVSIVIPAYNAANFIEESIHSILSQTYPSWEAIVVNDGSLDKTEEIARSFPGNKIAVVSQVNAGVSAARNSGLKHIKGEFVCFFDADDLMTPEFLQLRVDYLQKNPGTGFVGGIVETFPGVKKTYKPAAEDPQKEILFFDSSCVTLPSNYLFRREVLSANHIVFNTALSSTADRFFIMQLSRVSKGKFMDTEKGKLLYRVNENSMSHRLSPALLMDNEKFYFELKKNNLIPQGKKAQFNSIYFRGLAIGFARVKKIKKSLLYFTKSILADPFIVFKRSKR